MAKDTNFELAHMLPADPDITLKNILEKGAWPGSRSP